MAFDIPSATGNPIFLGVVFILFVLAIKRVTNILMNCVWITVAAVLLPLIANKIFGFPVPADADSLLFYIALGVGGYFVFILASSVYRILDIAERESKPVTGLLGGLFSRARKSISESAAKRRIKDEEKRARKEEERKRKEEEKVKKKEEEEKRLDEAKRLAAEMRMKEIEERGRKHPARKESFDDYLVIKDEDAEKEKIEREEVKPERKAQIRKKRKHVSMTEKFREAED
ncbi:MAG: hypothetical protein HYW26_03615 [Candidatus Aenigmarchaeota archaeon]|nr:hypothetical protein [Candidatus Aenigmarchaeota archaeon]